MIKPLFVRVAVFLFVRKGAKKGQIIYIVYLGDKQLLKNRLSIKHGRSTVFVFSLIYNS